MKNKLYFIVDNCFGLSLINNITKNNDLIVRINVYKYHSDTNHPNDLSKKYYFKFSHCLEFNSDGKVEKTKDNLKNEDFIMITPDYRIMPDNEDDLIKIVKRKLKLI